MPRGYPRYVLAVMVGINFLNYLDRYILPAVAADPGRVPPDRRPGWVTRERLPAGLRRCAIPFGLWADRGVRKTVIAIGVTIWSMATLFTGLARSYRNSSPPGPSSGSARRLLPRRHGAARRLFPEGRPGPCHVDLGLRYTFGIAVGFAGGGIVASILGWRAAFYMTAVPGLVFGILAFRLREPLRGAAEARGPQTGKAATITWRTFLELLRIPTLRATIAAETALFFVLGGAAFWLPTYLQRRFSLGTGTAGTLAGGVLVVGLAGSLLGGTIADRLAIRRRSASNLVVGVAGFILGAVFVALALLMPSLALFVPMFLLGAACLYLYNGPYTAVKQNIVLPTVRATAVTVALLIEHLLGDSYAPFAIGKLSDALHNLQLALLILLPPLLILAAVFAALGLRHEEKDGRAMETRWAAAATQIP